MKQQPNECNRNGWHSPWIMMVALLLGAAGVLAQAQTEQEPPPETVSAGDITTPRGPCPRIDWGGQRLTDEQLEGMLALHRWWLKQRRDRAFRELEWFLNCRARFYNADLSETTFTDSNLFRATFTDSDLFRATFTDSGLFRATFTDSDLTLATFTDSNLSGATFTDSGLLGATFTDSNLSLATFTDSNLSRATFTDSGLLGATFTDSNLFRATFTDSRLSGATFTGNLRLDNATFDNIRGGETVQGWTLMRWGAPASLPRGLQATRQSLRDAGYGDAAREITYAIRHNHRLYVSNKLKDGDLWVAPEAGLLWVFEATSSWGLQPGRPLTILAVLVAVGAVGYWWLLALGRPDHTLLVLWPIVRHPGRRRVPGLRYRIAEENGFYRRSIHRLPLVYRHRQTGWIKRGFGHLRRRLASRLRFNPADAERQATRRRRWQHQRRLMGVAFQFSLLSAFHIGWRELNVGNWIARTQGRPYVLHGTGWIRRIAGIQSLISVFLLAIAVLTYFGTPFDW